MRCLKHNNKVKGWFFFFVCLTFENRRSCRCHRLCLSVSASVIHQVRNGSFLDFICPWKEFCPRSNPRIISNVKHSKGPTWKDGLTPSWQLTGCYFTFLTLYVVGEKSFRTKDFLQGLVSMHIQTNKTHIEKRKKRLNI